MVVVAEVRKVAEVATRIVCVSLWWTVSSPSRYLDCLNVFKKTNTSSTPIPIITNVVATESRLNVSYCRKTRYTNAATTQHITIATAAQMVRERENPVKMIIIMRMMTALAMPSRMSWSLA